MAFYSRKEYWDERYKSDPEGATEWYQSYKTLRHLLNPIHFAAQRSGVRSWNRQPVNFPIDFPSRDDCRILILGCGNAKMGEDMRRDGWTGPIVNLDFSSTVIEQMKERYRQKHVFGVEFVCHDMTKGLPFADESFDLIICKGSFDAVLTSACPVADIRKVVQESVRCLKRGHGIFFVVTSQNPDNRLVYLEYQNDINHYWDGVSCHTVERSTLGSIHRPGTDYVYICRRRAQPLTASATTTTPKNVPVIPIDGKENGGNHGPRLVKEKI